jgi:hypothetical protein
MKINTIIIFLLVAIIGILLYILFGPIQSSSSDSNTVVVYDDRDRYWWQYPWNYYGYSRPGGNYDYSYPRTHYVNNYIHHSGGVGGGGGPHGSGGHIGHIGGHSGPTGHGSHISHFAGSPSLEDNKPDKHFSGSEGF